MTPAGTERRYLGNAEMGTVGVKEKEVSLGKTGALRTEKDKSHLA